MRDRGSETVRRLRSKPLRRIPESFHPGALAEIDKRLAVIRGTHGVHIPLAIESGSRAWGFPSPDSDYDCRFFYVRPTRAHLTPWPVRDVIETPLIDAIDLNGWDLAKALGLLIKGNAVVIEWLTSPICYEGLEWFRDEFLAFAERHARRNLVAHHYLHLGLRQNSRYPEGDTDVPLKKIFYCVRPAAALRWLRLHPDSAVAPMHFQRLMAESEPPATVSAIINELVDAKSRTHELGEAPLPPDIADFIRTEFESAAAWITPGPDEAALTGKARSEAKDFYRYVVERLDSPA